MVSSPLTVQIVLAAGRSERMGSPKPLLDFGGRTALELAFRAAEEAGVTESVVVVGVNAIEIVSAHARKRFEQLVAWVKNLEEGSEQLRSLQLALEACREDVQEGPDGFFIHPVDHPLATANDYKLLHDALANDTTNAGVFILSHAGRRGHPILCRWPVAEKILALGRQATAREVIEKEKIVYVATDNAGVREDMDTPEDYRRLAEAYRVRRGEGSIAASG